MTKEQHQVIFITDSLILTVGNLRKLILIGVSIAGFLVGLTIAYSIYYNQPVELLSPLPENYESQFLPRADADGLTGDLRANVTVDESENVVQLPIEPPVKQLAKITAYTCDPTMTEDQIAMNCPSLKNSVNGRTATGTTPRHLKTVACPAKYLGKQFEIEGVGVVTCEDVGGSIKGEARFDLFFNTYDEAIKWGTKYKSYQEV